MESEVTPFTTSAYRIYYNLGYLYAIDTFTTIDENRKEASKQIQTSFACRKNVLERPH